jgi:hypothetical protein
VVKVEFIVMSVNKINGSDQVSSVEGGYSRLFSFFVWLGCCSNGKVGKFHSKSSTKRESSRHNRHQQKTEADSCSRQAKLPSELVEHHEELHRQRPVQDPHARQLQ